MVASPSPRPASTRLPIFIFIHALAACAALVVSVPALAATDAAVETAAQEAVDSRGVIYGKAVTTRGETYQGRIRWNGDEESFWGDHFNGNKAEMPYFDQIPREDRQRKRSIRVLGISIGTVTENVDHGRSLVARFGDVETIEPQRRNDVVLHLKGGSRVEIDGGSNDVGADVTIWDRERGEVEIPWHRLARVELMPAPADLALDAFRLHGRVTSSAGTFEGYIEWDSDERLSTDVLDGEDPQGKDHEIPMGEIRSLAREGRGATRVVLRDGTELLLDGTNDVDSGNRGIVVDDPSYGRVVISWRVFERLDFSDRRATGPAYQDFEPAAPLRGTVTAKDGAKHVGRIVYDLDESETWEMLNSDRDGLEIDLPFALVRAIEPGGSSGSRVELVHGAVLHLGGVTDVDERNAGVLVLGADGKRTYLPWDEVRRIDFAP